MKRYTWVLSVFYLAIVCLVLAGFSKNVGATSGPVAQDPPTLASPIPPGYSVPILKDDYTVIARYGKSFLAEYNDGGSYQNKKRLLYLQGGAKLNTLPATRGKTDAYQRGYAEGYLCSNGVYRMTHDYVDNFLRGQISVYNGAPGDQIPQELVDELKNVLLIAVRSQDYAVPQRYKDEMQGIADGAMAYFAENGIRKEITYNEVEMINVGFDILYSLIYQGGSLACNEFAVFGNGTLDGRVYHGRDFMFTTGGGVFSDEALLIVQKPNEGFPFVAASVPGFVGFPTGMNAMGVSMGMDMVPNRQNRALVTGMGVLLLCRDVVQFAQYLGNTNQNQYDPRSAIDRVRNTSRGVSWLLQISDKNNSVALETVTNSMIPDQSGLLSTLSAILPGFGAAYAALPSPIQFSIINAAGTTVNLATEGYGNLYLHPKYGVAVRSAAYVYPEELNNYQIVIQMTDPLVSSAPTTSISAFPPQIENKPDLVGMSNHYILPQMNLTQAGIFYHTIDTEQGGGRESEWRYRTMMSYILDYYGNIDAQTAMYLIDFLNPNDQERSGSFYGTSTTQAVGGHHVVMDTTSLQMWVLHGYYDEPWIHVDLNKFLK